MGVAFDDAVLDAVFFSLDEEAAVQVASSRVTWEWWDGESPVNGVPAEQVRERFDVLDRAYMVYVDGALTYFQPHVPNMQGLESLTEDSVVPATLALEVTLELARGHLLTAGRAAFEAVVQRQQERDAEVAVAAPVAPSVEERRSAHMTEMRNRARQGGASWR